MRQPVADNDMNTEAEDAKAMIAVAKQRLVKTD
jgi:hypothetical protein